MFLKKKKECLFNFVKYINGKMVFNCVPKASLIWEYVTGFGRSFEHDQRVYTVYSVLWFHPMWCYSHFMNYCNKLVINIVKPVYSLGDWWPIQRILWLDTAKEILLVQGNFGLSRGYRWSKPSYIYFRTKFSRGLIIFFNFLSYGI